ncbi:hypothetical protein [Oceanirhabdus seepicola]|uniref:Uncharacterized protein n=1 Tax=Oceanirhabdus seepicola TaxID=2828781 RepID=A0A9J6P058_9CLOT|nr:hypothetical protein [Oceanirhabdus seepicola]MCM1989497.1 hypothetical protein [Oceanirhabdus seepicola]
MNNCNVIKFSNDLLRKYFNVGEYDIPLIDESNVFDNVNDKLNELFSISEDFHKYNSDWTFKYLEQSTTSLLDTVFTSCKIPSNEKDIQKCYQKQKHIINHFKNILYRYSNFIRFIRNAFKFLEIFLSVLLIVTISNISHSIEAIYHTLLMSASIAVTFALLKIFIERRFVIPLIEKLSSRKYTILLKRLYSILSTNIALFHLTEILEVDLKHSQRLVCNIYSGFNEIESRITNPHMNNLLG